MSTVQSSVFRQGSALAEPVTPVGPGWTALMFVANLGLWLALITPIQVLLPQQTELLFGADKTTMFNIVTAFGAAIAVFATPLAGLASDRTASRFGRRHPWTLGGALVGAAGLVVLANAGGLVTMVVGWCVVQAGLNGMLAGLTAALPDRVPVAQRAKIAGVIGITQILGVVVGTIVVTMLISGVSNGFYLCAVAVVVGAVLFVLLSPDVPLRPDERLGGTFGAALRGLWISPGAHPDFAWAWCGHFSVQLGNALGLFYLYFYLSDVIKLADPGGGLLIVMLAYAVFVTLGAIIAGVLSDRSGKRKPYIWLGVSLMAVATLMLAFWQTWTSVVVSAGLLGAGFGVYAAVGLALLTQVLPAASDRAKDLGIINVSQTVPQVITPVIAGLVISASGYQALYVVAALVTFVAAVLFSRVHSVR